MKKKISHVGAHFFKRKIEKIKKPEEEKKKRTYKKKSDVNNIESFSNENFLRGENNE